MNETCSCGRSWTHCKMCGGRSVYFKKFKSFEASEREGKKVTVYGCRSCGRETNTSQECKAPVKDFTPDYTPFVPPKVVIPSVNDSDFMEKANARLSELRRDGVSMDECVEVMLKEGWPVDKPADEKAADVVVKNPTMLVDALKNTEELNKPLEPPMSIDEILKQMTDGKEKL